MLNGFTRRLKPMDILTEDQVQAIHQGALDVLWQTGVRLESKKALKLLSDHGCKVDNDEMTVRFPPSLVEECLRKCPGRFRIKARDPEKDLSIGADTVYFLPFPARTRWTRTLGKLGRQRARSSTMRSPFLMPWTTCMPCTILRRTTASQACLK